MEKYSVLSLIGEGSFGRVYRATNLSNNQTVALKIIGKTGRTSKEIESLRGECEIQSKLGHPNIIRMFNSFETKKEIVFVTEYAQSDLHKFLSKKGSICEIDAQKLTFDLVSALYYLHSHRILHRDLKPQNILLDKDGRAKLCDFGLARNMTMGTHVLTSIKGTPLYMAPELLLEKPYDHQADLWSLGCIVYETLAGEPPFCTTSFIRLVRMIKNDKVKWPSFLSETCISFLRGLLEKNPALRLTWSQILKHSFVKDNIKILNESLAVGSPFTHPLSASQNEAKEKQRCNIMSAVTKSSTLDNKQKQKYTVSSCQDIIPSNLERHLANIDKNKVIQPNLIVRPNDKNSEDPCFVSGNYNLIVNHFNDNFKAVTSESNLKPAPNSQSKINNKSTPLKKSKAQNKNEKQKLTNTVDCNVKGSIQQNDKTLDSNKIPVPVWDSSEDHQSPPIENEEWLAFLQRSMQEVIDGDISSLKQQTLVSMIVALLRNYKASSKVIESVVQLLTIPLVLSGPTKDIADIRQVYVEAKLVPNLVYASKLLCNSRMDTVDTKSNMSRSSTFAGFKELTKEEFKTILGIYELVCHLIHLNEQFLSQFCDAVAILGTSELLIKFISKLSEDNNSIHLTNTILAILCCTLRELPENAEMIEKILFNADVNIITLMKTNNTLLKTRSCMLLRMIGRYSCCALQNAWSNEMKKTLQSLVFDTNEPVRKEAQDTLNEFKHLSFY